MIKVDMEKVDALISDNLKTSARTIRLQKITQERLEWLYYDHVKRGDRHSYSQLVNRAVDLFYDSYLKDSNGEQDSRD